MKSSNPNWLPLDRCALLLAISLLCASVIATASAAEPKESKREMLAKHQTVAQFQGVEYQQCRGLTSLCPDQCGGSGDFASFRILKYLAYEKPGKPSCSNHEHQLILDALTRRDAAKAAKLMLLHLENVEERLDLDRDARPPVDLGRLFAASLKSR